MTRDDLLGEMLDNRAPLIVDVRTEGEYDRDHVPGAVHIPFYRLGSGLEKLGISKQDPVLLYCEHGPRAGLGALTLKLYGYEHVYSLQGHMKGWRKNDFPLEMKEPASARKAPKSMKLEGTLNLPGAHAELVAEPVFQGQVYVYESGRQHEKTVVFIHGVGPEGMEDWTNLIPELVRQYHVVAFDLPGFGRSSKQNVIYSPEKYADFVCWVVRHYVHGPFVVIGHSLGGAVALRYAATSPEGMERLILVDVAGILNRVSIVKHLLQFQEADTGGREPVETVNQSLRRMLDALDRESVNRSLRDILADPALRVTLLGGDSRKIASLALILDDFSDIFDRVRVPVLILWGGHDDVAPLRTGKVLEAHLPLARLELIPNAGHSPMIEAPEQFNSVVMQELASPGSVERTKAVDVQAAEDRVVRCEGRNGLRLSGGYRLISLKGCKHVEISDATIGKMEMSRSEAAIENSFIVADTEALKVYRSELVLTNVVVSGEVAIDASRSRLDLAGVTLKGAKAAVTAEKESVLVFSVSSVESPFTRGHLHGSYKITQKNPF
jgi:pimeloyl-ACP methyl ester carboxylesterase/rhodanese-related sulfurtransferase